MIPLLGVAWAAPDPAALQAAITSAEAALQKKGAFAITLPPGAAARLAAGEVVRTREDLAGADRVIGALWTDRPRDALWIAILDDAHVDLVAGLTEAQLPGTGPLRKVLYQKLDLPFPLTDRQWVIDIQSNTALAATSAGQVWERSWVLGDPKAAVDADPDAIWTTVNEGGYLLIDAAGGTLLVYHVRSEVGGNVPDDASTRYAWSTLEELLRTTERRADAVPAHCDAKHAPVVRPDGTPIPPY